MDKVNPLIAQWLKANAHILKWGNGEQIYRQFNNDFPHYSNSYLTYEFTLLVSMADIMRMFGESIPDSSFNNIGVSDVYIPDSVRKIGNKAFYESEIERVSMPSAAFKENTFRSSEKLKTAEIRPGKGSTAYGMFADCTALQEVFIGNSVLDPYTFVGCTHLTTVRLSANLSHIMDNVFVNCIRLTSIYYGGTANEWELVTKHTNWRKHSPIKSVICSDKEIFL